jgi:hypothetical protein
MSCDEYCAGVDDVGVLFAPLARPLPPPDWRSAPNKSCRNEVRSCDVVAEEPDVVDGLVDSAPAGLLATNCCSADTSEE